MIRKLGTYRFTDLLNITHPANGIEVELPQGTYLYQMQLAAGTIIAHASSPYHETPIIKYRLHFGTKIGDVHAAYDDTTAQYLGSFFITMFTAQMYMTEEAAAIYGDSWVHVVMVQVPDEQAQEVQETGSVPEEAEEVLDNNDLPPLRDYPTAVLVAAARAYMLNL